MTTRHAIDDTGQSIPIEKLEEAVQSFLVTPEDFYKIELEELNDEDKEFADYPPCVQNFVKNAVKPGDGRNEALFNVGVCMLKKHGKDGAWEDELGEVNKSWGDDKHRP